MNKQQRSDERSRMLHCLIAKKLKQTPSLWQVPQDNIARWKLRKGQLPSAICEWEHILNTKTREEILALLESDSEESIRLRSSSPFTGILSENERVKIFKSYDPKPIVA
jgi:hypothetical protein